MTRIQKSVERRRLSRKIRETVAQRRYTATLIPVDQGEDARQASPEPLDGGAG